MAAEQDCDRTAEFTRALASLKRRGSNLLIVGTADHEAHLGACTRLLGEGGESRRRLFAFTDRDRSVAERLPGNPDAAAVVDYASPTRSAASVEPTERPAVADARTLSDLATAISTAIDDIAAVEALAPADFRFCLDSLRPLVDEYTEREVFRFLHGVTRDVCRVDGMAHYHLPVPVDDQTVRTLEPLFDATVELRVAPKLQQRWHLHESELSTDWLPLKV